MNAHGEPLTGNLVAGGILLGLWAFFALASGGDEGWAAGGAFALVTGLAMVGLRYVDGPARTALAITAGLLIGFGIMFLLMEARFWGFISALLAIVGTTVLVSGLPRPVQQAWQNVESNGTD